MWFFIKSMHHYPPLLLTVLFVCFCLLLFIWSVSSSSTSCSPESFVLVVFGLLSTQPPLPNRKVNMNLSWAELHSTDSYVNACLHKPTIEYMYSIVCFPLQIWNNSIYLCVRSEHEHSNGRRDTMQRDIRNIINSYHFDISIVDAFAFSFLKHSFLTL